MDTFHVLIQKKQLTWGIAPRLVYLSLIRAKKFQRDLCKDEDNALGSLFSKNIARKGRYIITAGLYACPAPIKGRCHES